MKFTPEHYQSLKKCVINALSQPGAISTLLNNDCEKQSDTRFLWDIFWLSNWSQIERAHYNDGNYDDSHIQTAMKNIMKEIQ